MTTSPYELVDSLVPEFEIVAVKDDSGLETAARVAAGDGGSLDAFRALYAPGMLVAGMSVYLGVVDGEPVTTAHRLPDRPRGCDLQCHHATGLSPPRLRRGDHSSRNPCSLRQRSGSSVAADERDGRVGVPQARLPPRGDALDA